MRSVFNNLRAPWLEAFSVLSRVGVISAACTVSLWAQTGYGYKKGQDPLILSVKKIVLEGRRGRWTSVEKEYGELDWQFRELREDLGVDLSDTFRAAVKRRTLSALSPEISRLLYYALVQKFFWNEKEELKVYIKAKSRADAALYYYEEILAIGVRNFDRVKKKDHHRKILDAFRVLRRSVGSAGLFGFQARPPDLEAFRTSRAKILKLLTDVYPHVKAGNRTKERS